MKPIAMKFRDGTVFAGIRHEMRPEHRGKSTFDLILEGNRTATTRKNRPRLSVGDIVTFADRDGRLLQAQVTADPYPLSEVSPEDWSRLEGWTTAVFRQYAKIGAWQFQYRLLEDSRP